MASIDSTVKVARVRRMLVVALITLALGTHAPAIHESHAQDKTGADASKLTPDQRADQVTQYLKENKKKAADLQKDPCPTTEKDWQEWKKKALEIWACVIASGSMGEEPKKDGAGKDKLGDYEKERGSKAEQKTAANNAIGKAIE